MTRLALSLLVALALCACRGSKKSEPSGGPTSSTSVTAASAEPEPEKPLEVPVSVGGTDLPNVRTSWGFCHAYVREGMLYAQCFADRLGGVSMRAKYRDGPEKKGEAIKGGGLVGVSVVPMLVEVLGDATLPLKAAPPVRIEPHMTFVAHHRTTPITGTLAPFEIAIDKLLDDDTLSELAKTGGGPLLFKGETPGDAPPTAHSAILIHTQSALLHREEKLWHQLAVVGPAARVRDADLIAVEEGTTFDDSGKKCGPYKGTEGADAGQRVMLPLFTQKTTVVLRERRSGKELARKEFASAKDCNADLRFTVYERKVRSDLRTAPIEKWLKSQFKAIH